MRSDLRRCRPDFEASTIVPLGVRPRKAWTFAGLRDAVGHTVEEFWSCSITTTEHAEMMTSGRDRMLLVVSEETLADIVDEGRAA